MFSMLRIFEFSQVSVKGVFSLLRMFVCSHISRRMSEIIVCPACGTLNRVPSGAQAASGKCGQCKGWLFDSHPVAVDEAGLDRHVRSNSIPVLVDIWAPWCAPCRQMAPQFEKAASMLEPSVRLLKLNADESQATCARLGVRGIPALVLFQKGAVSASTAGAMGADAIVRWATGSLQ